MDASVSHSWKGIEGDGCDYKEACKLFDVNPSIEGGPISIDGETGMLWEMKGPGTADAFMNDHLVIVRTWPTNPSDTTASLYFANEPILNPFELGRLTIRTGVIAILWATENGQCVQSLNIPLNGRPTGPMAIGTSGLIAGIEKGNYRCLHDQVEARVGMARRFHLLKTDTE